MGFRFQSLEFKSLQCRRKDLVRGLAVEWERTLLGVNMVDSLHRHRGTPM